MTKKDFPAKHGLPWTDEEVLRLMAAHKKGKTVAQLAQAHQRTAGAIRSQLKKVLG